MNNRVNSEVARLYREVLKRRAEIAKVWYFETGGIRIKLKPGNNKMTAYLWQISLGEDDGRWIG